MKQKIETDNLLELPDDATASLISEFSQFWRIGDKFRARGFDFHPLDAEVQKRIRDNAACQSVEWLIGNAMLLTRKPVAKKAANKVVVYSAMMGKYDTLKPLQDLGVPAVMFTETAMEAEGWENRVMTRPERHPRLRAKWFKLHPHVLFPDAAVSIWIDSSVLVQNPNFVTEAITQLKDAPLTFFPHRWRTNLRDELTASMEHPKYWGLPGQAQIDSYYAEGFQDTDGLMECTVLVRRHNDEAAIYFDEAWWAENVKWTYMDQLSCTYALWRTQQQYPDRRLFTLFPVTLATQQWFRIASWRADK